MSVQNLNRPTSLEDAFRPVEEMTDIVEQFQRQLADVQQESNEMKERFSELVLENSKLRQQLEQSQARLLEISKTEGGSFSFNPDNAVSRQEIEELTDQLDLINEEKAALEEQIAVLQSDRSQLTAQIAERDQKLAQQTSHYEMMSSTYDDLQAQCQGLRSERDVLQSKISEIADHATSLELSANKMKQNLSESKESEKSITITCQKYKKALDELSTQYKEETSEMLSRMRAVTAERDKLRMEVDDKDGIIDEYKIEITELTRMKTALEKDCEDMVKVIEISDRNKANLEQSIQSMGEKQRTLISEHNDMQNELRRCQAREEQCRAEIARLLQKSQIAEEEATRVKFCALKQQREQHSAAMDRKQQEILQLSTRIADLEQDAARTSREMASLSTERDHILDGAKNEIARLKEALDGVTKRSMETQADRDSMEQRLIEAERKCSFSIEEMKEEYESRIKEVMNSSDTEVKQAQHQQAVMETRFNEAQRALQNEHQLRVQNDIELKRLKGDYGALLKQRDLMQQREDELVAQLQTAGIHIQSVQLALHDADSRLQYETQRSTVLENRIMQFAYDSDEDES